MELVTQVSNPDPRLCFTSHSRKGMIPFVLSFSSFPKLRINCRINGFFRFGIAIESRRRENSEFKPVVLCLKVDLVSHPAHGGEVV